MKDFIKNIIVVAVVAFTLQLIWEYAQCDIFYTMNELTNGTRLMLSATFGDMMMSIILYGLLAFVNTDVNWILKKWHRHDHIITMLYALFLSFYFEISALYNNRWGYNETTMPLFPNTNIALIPVIQLVVLFPIIFIISRAILRRLAK
jgi:hypothetical protein